MPELVWKDIVVADSVDAASLHEGSLIPPPSTQVSALIASLPHPPAPRRHYAPTNSSLAAYLGDAAPNLSASRQPQNSTHNADASAAAPAPDHITLVGAQNADIQLNKNDDAVTNTRRHPTSSTSGSGIPSGLAPSDGAARPPSTSETKSVSAGSGSPRSSQAIPLVARPPSASASSTSFDAGACAPSTNIDAGNLSNAQAAPPIARNPSNSEANAVLAGHGRFPDANPSSARNLEAPPPPMPPKKKRAEMGPAERKLAREASSARSKKLADAIDGLLEEQESLFSKVADENNVTATRVKRLANQVPGVKEKKATSDYNILFYYKNKELNSDRPAGSKILSKDIHEAVKEDEELQSIRNDKDAMAELRAQYEEDKSDDEKSRVRVSKRREAKTAASQVNAFQQSADYLYDSVNVTSFGIIARSSLDSTVVASYFGRGPVDEFLRSEYGTGIQQFAQHFESWVLARNAKLRNKMSVTEMGKDLTHSISQGLSEITGIRGISMNYATFELSISVPYKVAIKGWPPSVPWGYPQKLNADEVRALHAAWNDNRTHWYRMTASEHRTLLRRLGKEGKLAPKERKKRKAGQSKKQPGVDYSSTSDSESHPETNEGSSGNPGRHRKKAKTSTMPASSKPSTSKKIVSKSAKKGSSSHDQSRPRPRISAKVSKKLTTKRAGKKKSVKFTVSSSEEDEDEDYSSQSESESEAENSS
ncbi:hypothetical protein F5878DRAFT_635220 [Lentinula raphanica]|uniref:Uncharacterized protein n=1 Tax=Lentinula raphanica TaxID=153919 RepID=A0AA38UB21_9AGAR|nr:hypothetical protein F5878DRAFT_635220 [Lentinula raphanica]